MKIVVVETDAQGGLIHFAYQLAEGLARSGTRTTLLTGQHYELAHLPHLSRPMPKLRFWRQADDGLPAVARRFAPAWRPVRRSWRAAVTLREWRRVTRFILDERPDVAIFSVIRFPFLAIYLHRIARAGIPMVQICHEFEAREATGTAMKRLPMLLSRASYAQFRAILFLSERTREAFLEAFPVDRARTFVIPHGPELLFSAPAGVRHSVDGRYGLHPKDRVALLFGGLRPSKGVPDLLRAFALLADTPRLRLVIAGYPSRGFDADGARELARDLGIAERTVFDMRYLSMDELGALIARSDVVVFPYRSATASGAVALAQTLGRPVIATAVGGLAEAIEDGVTGRLVPPGDTDALAAAMADTLSSPSQAQEMADRAKAVAVLDNNWDEIARRVRKILAELGLDSDSGGPSRVRTAPVASSP